MLMRPTASSRLLDVAVKCPVRSFDQFAAIHQPLQRRFHFSRSAPLHTQFAHQVLEIRLAVRQV